MPAADIHRVESFDTSGMPHRPTNFVEQQILEMIASHKWGDLADAERIQRKLGRYYDDKGDEERSRAALMLAAAAEEAVENGNRPVPVPAPVTVVEVPITGPDSPAMPLSAGSKLAGNYFGTDGRTLNTWEFHTDGTFLHTWAASGTGTSVRNSERGQFQLSSDTVVLKIASSASGFTTPGVGGRSTLVGGAADSTSEIRKLKIQFLKSEKAILLDGIKLKPKSW